MSSEQEVGVARRDGRISRQRFFQLAGLASVVTALQCSPRFPAREINANFYNTLLKALLKEASPRRHWGRIDPGLNRNRVNFAFYSYGELYYPADKEDVYLIGSPTVVSLSPSSIDFISVSHEIRSPEVERHLQREGRFDGFAKTLDQAYFEGGFPLLRVVLESATALSIDYQAAADEIILADLINQLFGSIEVDVPIGFRAHPFYLRGERYPAGHFSAGTQSMDGIRAIQFLVTIPNEEIYSKDFENTTRKHVLLESLMSKFESSANSPLFWPKVASFLLDKLRRKEISHDIDLISLGGKLFTPLAHIGSYAASIPKRGAEMYISDPGNSNFGDGLGGVQWIAAAAHNPIFKEELVNGFYPDPNFKVPYDFTTSFKADPHAQDLITGYWKPVRERIIRSFPG